MEVPTGEVEVPTGEVDTLDVGGDEDYIDVVDHSLEDLDQKIASHAHTRILRPQRTKEAVRRTIPHFLVYLMSLFVENRVECDGD